MSKAWNQFRLEAHAACGEFREYFCSVKVFRWFTALWIFLIYGIRLFHGDIFVDSDIMISDPEVMMFSWYGHQRFGLNIMKKLFFFGRLMPTVSNGLMMFALWLFVILIGFCFDWWGRGSQSFRRSLRIGMFPFTAVFLSSPCLAEQVNFVLQAFEVCLAMVFCGISVFCAQMAVRKGSSPFWYAPALFFMVWSMGTYQAFPAFYIGLTVMAYLVIYLTDYENAGLREGILDAGLFLVGFLVTQATAMWFVRRTGASPSYVNSMLYWKSQGILAGMNSIRIDIGRIYFGNWSVFFSQLFLVTAGISSGLILGTAVKRKSGRLFCCVFALLVLFASPVLTTLLTGMAQPMRGHLTYSLIYAGHMFWISALLFQWMEKQKKGSVLIFAGVMVFFAGLSWKQLVTSCGLFETAHEIYVTDSLLANRIYSAVCQIAGQEDMNGRKVAFVGTKRIALAGNPVLGDVIGHSVFQWDEGGPVGVSHRVCSFFLTLGLPMMPPSAEEYQLAVEASRERPSWPDQESVFTMEDVVVVKLSDEERP